MLIQTSYIDFNDLENPVKKKTDRNQIVLLNHAYTQNVIRVIENDYEIDDSYFSVSTKTGKFYSLESMSTSSRFYNTTETKWNLASFQIRLGNF